MIEKLKETMTTDFLYQIILTNWLLVEKGESNER